MRRTDQVGQGLHFPGVRDARLKQRHFVVGTEVPDRQRHPHLGVVAARTAHYREMRCKQQVEPFFDHGFAVASGNAHHRQLVAVAVRCGQGLQATQRIGDHHLGGVARQFHFVLRQKQAHPGFIRTQGVLVAVVTRAFECDKQRIPWKMQLT